MGTSATASGGDAVAIGRNTQAANGAIAVGFTSQATTPDAIALGTRAAATGANGIALGLDSAASGPNSLALGNNASAGGLDSLAFGRNANASANGGIAMGFEAGAGNNGVAIGIRAAAAGNAIAFGTDAAASQNNAIAIGNGASAANASDVALGQGSVTAAAVATPSTVINGTTYNFAGAAPTSTVSIGSATVQRTLTNVAAGRLSATSTDAVNGSQLFATNQAVNTLGTKTNTLGNSLATALGGSSSYDPATGTVTGGFSFGGNSYTSVQNVFDQVDAAFNGGGIKYFHANSTLADSQAAGADSVAIGPASVASGANSFAAGNGATAGFLDAIALGRNTSVTANGGIAVGRDATAGNNGIGMGIGASAAGNAIAFGTSATASQTNSLAFGNGATANGGGAMAFGATTTATGLDAITIGRASQVTDHGGIALGGEAIAGVNGVALGFGASATEASSVALGQGSVAAAAVATPSTVINGATYNFAGAAPTSTVSIGAVGAERTLTNLAAGRLSAASTDAVNGSQLFATNQAVGALGTKTDTLGSSVATALGGSSSYDPTTGTVTGGFSFGGNTYNNVQNVFDQVNAAIVGGGGIKYFHANSALPDNTAAGADSVAIGPAAVAQNANDVAMGNGATTAGGQTGDVAIGAGSTTAPVAATTGVTLLGATYSFAGAAPLSTFSIGAPGAERTLTNMAAGRIAADSTDGVNGSQLFATNQAVEGLNGRVNTLGGSVANLFGGNTTYDPTTGQMTGGFNYAGNTYNNIQSVFNQIDGAVNGGSGIKYFHANSTLADSSASGANSVAVGPQAVSAGENSVAMGNGAQANGGNSVALGANSVAGDAVATSSTVIDGKTYNFAGAAPVGAVSVGSAGGERTITNVAAGRISGTSTDAVNGSQLYATNQAVDNLSTRVGEVGQVVRNSVSYDTNPDGSRSNSISLIGGDPNAPVVIRNVAAGTAPTDAVNVGQLNEGLSNAVAQSKAYTDSRLAGLSSDIGSLRREARQAAAVGLAAASLRYDDRPGKVSASVGGGAWRGQGALAFGVGYTSESGLVRANLSATTTGRQWGVGAGVSITLN